MIVMASLREKIGQMLLVGLRAMELSAEERSLVRTYPFGGFIHFSHNLGEPKQIFSLRRSLWQTDSPGFKANSDLAHVQAQIGHQRVEKDNDAQHLQ